MNGVTPLPGLAGVTDGTGVRAGDMTRITADLLIPGRGDPVRDGVVVLDGALISYAGPAAQAPDTPGAAECRAVTVLPGLWDCHGHFLGQPAWESG
jgi:imidazolonepropionase-like amidohydrolase